MGSERFLERVSENDEESFPAHSRLRHEGTSSDSKSIDSVVATGGRGGVFSDSCDCSTNDKMTDAGPCLTRCKCAEEVCKLERSLTRSVDRLRADLRRDWAAFRTLLERTLCSPEYRIDGVTSPGVLHRQTDSFGKAIASKRQTRDNASVQSDDSDDLEDLLNSCFGEDAAMASSGKHARPKCVRGKLERAFKPAAVTKISEPRPTNMKELNNAHFHGIIAAESVPVRTQAWQDANKETNPTREQLDASGSNSREKGSSGSSEVRGLCRRSVAASPSSTVSPARASSGLQQQVTCVEEIEAAQSDQIIHHDACDDSRPPSSKDGLSELTSLRCENGLGIVPVPEHPSSEWKPTSCTLNDLRKLREETLMEQTIRTDADPRDADHPVLEQSACVRRFVLALPHGLLTASGIMRFARNGKCDFFGMFVILLLVLLCVITNVNAMLKKRFGYSDVADAVFAWCVLAGLIFLRKHCDLSFGPGARSLTLYATRHGFFTAWMLGSLRRFVVIWFTWVLSIVTHTVPLLCASDTRDSQISNALTFAFVSAFFSMQMYFILHISCCLELMVDAFCVRFFTEGNYSRGISEWNTVQAILRRTACVIEVCFIFLQASVVMALVLTSTEMATANWVGDESLSRIAMLRFLGWLPFAFLMLYCVFKAAGVTEKCRRAPSLVNSLIITPEETINFERQYMVDFMMQTEAGFYVLGIRLTVFMVFKCSYVLFLATLTMVTQLRVQD